jgi:predicted nucleic acid-binding protein
MGIVESLIHKRVYLDTAPIIYYIENHYKYSTFLDNIFELNAQGKITFITSTLTILEVLVQPLRLKRMDIAESYLKILTSSKTLEVVDLSIEVSTRAAELRAKYNVKTPDAIQLATAIESHSDFFLTNDIKLEIDEIKSIILDKAT